MVGQRISLWTGALAEGTTRIINSAQEPEVVQMCEILKEARCQD